MFHTYTQLARKTGKNEITRPHYLRLLVTEYYDAEELQFRLQVVANLANFAYDPLNFDWLLQADATNVFLHSLSELEKPGRSSSDDSVLRLVEYAVAGLCNLCVYEKAKQQLEAKQVLEKLCRCFERVSQLQLQRHCSATQNVRSTTTTTTTGTVTNIQTTIMTTLFFLINCSYDMRTISSNSVQLVHDFSVAADKRLANVAQVLLEQLARVIPTTPFVSSAV